MADILKFEKKKKNEPSIDKSAGGLTVGFGIGDFGIYMDDPDGKITAISAEEILTEDK